MNLCYPTGTCFDDAIELFSDYVKAGFHPKRLRLVHAICLGPNGDEYSHAWLERKSEVHTVVLYRGTRRLLIVSVDEFYREVQLRECTYYSARELLKLNKLHGTYGPWEEKYIALCRKSSCSLLNS